MDKERELAYAESAILQAIANRTLWPFFKKGEALTFLSTILIFCTSKSYAERFLVPSEGVKVKILQ